MIHVHVVLLLLCGVVSSAHALCSPGTYFIYTTQACGVCPAGEFAANATTPSSRRQGTAETCGRTVHDTIGCSEAPQGVDVQACVTDVLNLLEPLPGEYDWDQFSTSIQSGVLGKNGRIFFMMKRREVSFYVFNINDHTIQKLPSLYQSREPYRADQLRRPTQVDYFSGGVYVAATESIYAVPPMKPEIHVLRMHDLDDLQVQVLSVLPASTTTLWTQQFGSPVLVGMSVYFVPMDEIYMLVLHIAPDGSTTTEHKDADSANNGDVFSGLTKFTIGVAVGTMLFFIPWNADHVGMMDLAQSSAPIPVPVPSDLRLVQFKYSDAALANDGYIYLAPCVAPYFAKIDPITGQIIRIHVVMNGVAWTRSTFIMGDGDECSYSSLVQGRNNKIYFAPYHASYVFEMDLLDISISKEITPGGIFSGKSDLGQYSKAILANNGLIYLLPGRSWDLANVRDENTWEYYYTVPLTVICAPGQPRQPGFVCTPCPSNSSSAAGDATCSCNAGYEPSLAEELSCLQCPPQSYTTLPGQSCIACEGDYVLNPTQDGCWTACILSQYRDPGTNLCEYCPAGYRMVGGTRLGAPASQCEMCSVGKYKPTPPSGAST